MSARRDVVDDADENGELEDANIPQEDAVDQRLVPFVGDDLTAALTSTGAIYITLPGMCMALGLNQKGQMQRIKRTTTLVKGLRRIPLESLRGGVQATNCLRVDKVALWLAGVQTRKVKEPFRAKIETYQEELAPVATQVFLRVVGLSTDSLVPTNAPPQAHDIAKQIDALSDIINLLREHLAGLLSLPEKVDDVAGQLQHIILFLEALAGRQHAQSEQITQIDERTQRLTPAHTRAVKEFIDHMVTDTKSVSAPLTYAMIYGRLKHRFRMATYKEIADDHFPGVMMFLQDELRRSQVGERPAQGALF